MAFRTSVPFALAAPLSVIITLIVSRKLMWAMSRIIGRSSRASRGPLGRGRRGERLDLLLQLQPDHPEVRVLVRDDDDERVVADRRVQDGAALELAHGEDH